MDSVAAIDIKPAPYNPRKITEEELRGLKNSMDKFGDISGITFNKRTGNLVGGHHRWDLLKSEHSDLEFDHIRDESFAIMSKSKGFTGYLIRIVDWDKSIEKAANVAANSNYISGKFDMEILPSLIAEIKSETPDLYTDLRFDVMSEDFFPEAEVVAPIEGEDDVPEVPKEPKSKRGDIFKLGNHRLMCGDSTMIDDVEKLMDGQKADMVFTDPPYNVNYESDHSGKIKNDNMSDESFEQFIRDVYKNLYLSTKDNASLYIAHATMVMAFDTVLREFDWKINNKIIWVKDIPTYSMAKYKWKYEPIYFVIKGSPVFNGDKTETNVWEFKSIQSAGNSDEMGNSWFKGGSKNLTLHPTQKPFQLVEHAIIKSSNKNDFILDLFGGSGSTLVSCEKNNRRCFTMELDPKFCDVIVARWEKFSGKKASLLKDGQEILWDEL